MYAEYDYRFGGTPGSGFTSVKDTLEGLETDKANDDEVVHKSGDTMTGGLEVGGDLVVGDSSVADTTTNSSPVGHLQMLVKGNIVRKTGTDAEVQSYYDDKEHHIYRQANTDFVNSGDNGASGTTHRITFGYTDELEYPYSGQTGRAPTHHAMKFEVASRSTGATPTEIMRLEYEKVVTSKPLTVSGTNEITYKGETLDDRFVKTTGDTMSGNLTIEDGNLIVEHSSNSGEFDPYLLLNSNQNGVPYNGLSTLFLTEQFINRDRIQGAYIEYDGDGNYLRIGTQNNFDTNSSGNPRVEAIRITRGSSSVVIQGNAIVDNPPTDNTHLTNKLYVDTEITDAINDLKGGASGAYDTLIELENELKSNDGAIDGLLTAVAGKVSKSGDTMSGALTVNDALTATGSITGGSLNTSGTLSAGATTLSGALTVSGTNEIYYKGEALDAQFHSLDNDYYTEAESDARFVNVAGDTMTGNLMIESETEDPKLTLWSKNTGGLDPTIDLIRNSETFGGDYNYDWRITNDGGTFKIQTQGTISGYDELRTMVSIGFTDAGLTLLERLNVGGKLYVGETTSPVVPIRDWEMDLSSQNSGYFYPVVFVNTNSQRNHDGVYPSIEFEIFGQSLGGSNSYNEQTIKGYVRPGGWTDHANFYEFTSENFTTSEMRVSQIWRSTQSNISFAVYVRGGYKYTVRTNADNVIQPWINPAVGQPDLVFTYVTSGTSTYSVKTASGVDASPSGTITPSVSITLVADVEPDSKIIGSKTVMKQGLDVGGDLMTEGDLVIDSPVRDDLDMKMVCGSTISGITENRIYLKSGSDDGGATYLQYQDGTNAVEGVEIYVKDDISSQNRVAQFQEDLIVLEKDVSVLGRYKQASNPLINVSFCSYQSSANPGANSYINLYFLHPFVDSTSVLGATVSQSHTSSVDAIYNACFPHRFKISSVVLMYDNDGNTNSSNVKIRVNSNSFGNGTLTDHIVAIPAKSSTQRTRVVNLTTENHITVASGVFSAQISNSTSNSPETTVYFYGYQY
jgi:hypothetical protein